MIEVILKRACPQRLLIPAFFFYPSFKTVQKFKEAETHTAAMMAANTSLRESGTASNERMERTVEALRIAGTNAANARADADAAEAYAASLASQLESLRHVVEETKRATKILHDEHETVASATRSVESKLLQRETELLHLQKDRKSILADREKLKFNAQSLIDDKKTIELQLERKQEQHKTLSRELDERDDLEQARKERSAMVEKELRDARAMLVDASTTAVETETTTLALKETIQTLQQENKTLHAKIEEIQDRSRRNEERLQETLVKTEKSAQTLRIKATAHDEHVQRVLSEKAGCEKQVTQLKTRVTNLERRLKESASFMSPTPKQTLGGEPTTEKRRPRKSFQVPPLTPGNIANKSPASSTKRPNSCCMCFKSSSGLMKTCQCGKPNCDKRAHSTCLAGNKNGVMSISHPGTPSPRLPIILCSSPLV